MRQFTFLLVLILYVLGSTLYKTYKPDLGFLRDINTNTYQFVQNYAYQAGTQAANDYAKKFHATHPSLTNAEDVLPSYLLPDPIVRVLVTTNSDGYRRAFTDVLLFSSNVQPDNSDFVRSLSGGFLYPSTRYNIQQYTAYLNAYLHAGGDPNINAIFELLDDQAFDAFFGNDGAHFISQPTLDLLALFIDKGLTNLLDTRSRTDLSQRLGIATTSTASALGYRRVWSKESGQGTKYQMYLQHFLSALDTLLAYGLIDPNFTDDDGVSLFNDYGCYFQLDAQSNVLYQDIYTTGFTNGPEYGHYDLTNARPVPGAWRHLSNASEDWIEMQHVIRLFMKYGGTNGAMLRTTGCGIPGWLADFNP